MRSDFDLILKVYIYFDLYKLAYTIYFCVVLTRVNVYYQFMRINSGS